MGKEKRDRELGHQRITKIVSTTKKRRERTNTNLIEKSMILYSSLSHVDVNIMIIRYLYNY